MAQGISVLPPGLQGFVAAQEQNQGRDTAQLWQLSTLLQVAGAAHKQQQERAYQSKIAAADTPEKQLAAAIEFGGPAAVIGHADRTERTKATQEATLGRIAQQASQFDQMMQYRFQQAKTADEQRAIENQWKQGRLNLQQASVRMAGAKLYDETGINIGIPTVPQLGGQPAADPLAGRPQNEIDAIRMVQSGQATSARAAPGMAAEMVTQAPQGMAPAPQPAAPVAPQPVVATPAAPGMPVDREIARLPQPVNAPGVLGAATAAAPVAGPVASSAVLPATALAPSAPTVPQMPDFTGSPKDIRTAQNRWRLEQSRPSIAGSGPLTPDTLKRVAEQALNGDEKALAPWSRNQRAMAEINEEITRQANELGLSGGDIVGRRAATAANRTALTAVTKDLAAITPFKEMLDTNAKVAIDLGRKIASDKTNSAFVNRPLLWVKNNLSDRPDIAEYLAQMHFIEVEAARVLTQPRLVGQLTDQAISDMKSILSGNMTIASTEAVINRILSDGNNRISAMKSQQARTLAEIKGGSPKTRSTDKPTADQFFK